MSRAAGAPAIRAARRKLLAWYRSHGRDLPWRRTDDPYAIWVSEVMLQQTQVATVVPYYGRFLERFPDVAALARAPEPSVLAAWSGLGYYARARALREAARAVLERHRGRIPEDPAALRALPGVGRYTAGAIASVAFGREEPVVDGNVRRVLTRLFAVRAPGPAAAEASLWSLARTLVRGPSPGDLNQALMDLGALVCTPRAPRCPACPVARECRGLASGAPERFRPHRAAVRPAATERVGVALLVRGGRILLERPRRNESPLRGSFDLPAVVLRDGEDPRARIEAVFSERHDLAVRVGEARVRASHAILSRRFRLEGFDCRLLAGGVSGRPELRWGRLDAIAEIPVSGATRKLLRAYRSSRGAAQEPTPADARRRISSGSTSSGASNR